MTNRNFKDNDGLRPKLSTNQAKLLDDNEFKIVEDRLKAQRNSDRNLVALYLSHLVGLRAHEIARLEWNRHVLTPRGKINGDVLKITDDIAKGGEWGRSGRAIPMPTKLRKALETLRAARPDDKFVFHPLIGDSVNGQNSSAAVHKFFERLYADCGFKGASSHSGRRTFITRKAQQANNYGCSIRDVQIWAGHAGLATTQSYIEVAPKPAQHSLINVRN